MKFAILLLLCCCAAALARPDGSKEVASTTKHSSIEVKHSGEDSKGSNESKESSDESGDKSSNESGRNDDGGAVIGIPIPNVQQMELLLDRAVEIVSTIFGLRNIHGYVDLIHLIQRNPLGNIIWTIVLQPFLQGLVHYEKVIISFLANLQTMILQYFPIFHLFIPLQLPQPIIQFILRILECISQIFSRPI